MARKMGVQRSPCEPSAADLDPSAIIFDQFCNANTFQVRILKEITGAVHSSYYIPLM